MGKPSCQFGAQTWPRCHVGLQLLKVINRAGVGLGLGSFAMGRVGTLVLFRMVGGSRNSAEAGTAVVPTLPMHARPVLSCIALGTALTPNLFRKLQKTEIY
eukprot:6014508-Karenia_brevis.AAC.1